MMLDINKNATITAEMIPPVRPPSKAPPKCFFCFGGFVDVVLCCNYCVFAESDCVFLFFLFFLVVCYFCVLLYFLCFRRIILCFSIYIVILFMISAIVIIVHQ